MSGMGSSTITTENTTIVTAFQTSLLHQLLIVLVILLALAIAWSVLRAAQLRRAMEGGGVAVLVSPATPEPLARKILRISFGLIWLFDGILQGQSAMPVGLADQVMRPASAGSPAFVVHIVNAGSTIWDNHPVTAAVAAVWIQVAIGVWLLVAPRGRWSRAAAIVSVGWGLIVWAFGEAFGQIFAPGLTILFGAPGAAVFYCLAGVLIALPERVWWHRRTVRLMLAGMGLFLIGMAILQAWPGRGFWQGTPGGSLVSMVQPMAKTPQPQVFAQWVAAFASFDASHGALVNAVVVAVLVLVGAGLCVARRPFVDASVALGCLFFLADWVLIEDFGFFGGLGTDPNSMIPMIVVVLALYMGLIRAPAPSELAAVSDVTPPVGERFRTEPAYALRSLAALGAVAVLVLGAAPMALASTDPNADAVITEAINGSPDQTNAPAPPFALVDQNGRTVSLAGLRGKAIALTFLDPVCTTDCPVIAQEFKDADLAMGGRSRNVAFLAIVANPIYSSTFYTRAFTATEGLGKLSNWHFLTGTDPMLAKLWAEYGVEVTVSPAGAMVDHSEIAYVIAPDGHTRAVLGADPGENTTDESSFVTLLEHELNALVPST